MIYLSTLAFEDEHYCLNEMAEFAAKFECGLEFGSNALPADIDLSELTIPMLIHNYNPIPDESFVLNLSSMDPLQLAKSIDMVARNLTLSHKLNMPFYGLHAGFLAKVEPSMLGTAIQGGKLELSRSYSEYCTDFAVNLGRAFALSSAPPDYPVLIENNVIGSKNFRAGFSSHLLALGSEDTTELLGAVHERGVNARLLFDVGHAKVSGYQLGFSPHRFHDQVKGMIGAYHLSENNGLEDTNQPISGDSWFLEFLRERPGAIVTLEVRGSVRDLTTQIEILKGCGC